MVKSDFIKERQIGEYLITLPEPPPLKEIHNYGLKPKEQKFPVIQPPKDYDLLFGDDQKKIQLEQWGYRENGIWFYNNGNIEYVTGLHWFYLTHWYIDTGLPKFIDADRDFFYLWDYVVNKRNCFGLAAIENRRAGKTFRGTCILYEGTSKTKEADSGIQSKTDDDAGKVFAKLIKCWRRLHEIFKPLDIGDSDPKTKLVFDAPAKRDTKSQRKVYRDALRSQIRFGSSKESTFDGDKMFRYFLDEYGKFSAMYSPVEIIRIVKETLMEDGIPKGKMYASTTVEEMTKRGGDKAKIIWDDSRPDTSIFGSQTGLCRYFKPCWYGYYGIDVSTGEMLVDEWGYTREKEAKEYFMKRRKAVENDLQAYRAEVQKYPFTVDEAFYIINEGSIFNLFNIAEQKAHNESSPIELFERGDLAWKDGVVDGDVEFIKNPTGSFIVAKRPPVGQSNLYVIRDGKKSPNRGVDGADGVIGIDPVSLLKTYGKRKSDLAAVGFDFFKPNDPLTHIPTFTYCCRKATSMEMAEDMIMACVFWGVKAHIERNTRDLIIHFKQRGYKHYLMKRMDLSKSTGETKEDDDYGTPNVDPVWRSALVSAAKDYIQKYVGYKTEIDEKGNEVKTDEMGKVYLNELLTSFEDFIPSDDWTPYDLPVAFMHAVICSKQYVTRREQKQTNFVAYIPTYEIKTRK